MLSAKPNGPESFRLLHPSHATAPPRQAGRVALQVGSVEYEGRFLPRDAHGAACCLVRLEARDIEAAESHLALGDFERALVLAGLGVDRVRAGAGSLEPRS